VVEQIYAFLNIRRLVKVSLDQLRKKYNLTTEDIQDLNNAIQTNNEEILKQLLKDKCHNEIADSEAALLQEQLQLLVLPRSSADIERDVKRSKEYGKKPCDLNVESVEGVSRGRKFIHDSMILYRESDAMILHMVDNHDDVHVTTDKFGDEAMWAITINHKNKRITVVFRGSPGDNEWRPDFNIHFTDMKLHGPNSTDLAMGKVHEGFYQYLFNGTTMVGSDPRVTSKVETIMGELQSLFSKHKDYKLYVTGHSIGAAISTLFAFRAAYDSSIPNKPVVNITFASPYVGNWEFRKHFRELERQGKIRHLRVSNQDDVVPLTPNFSLHKGSVVLYKHVGLHLKLFRDEGILRKSFHNLSYPKPNDIPNSISRIWNNNAISWGITFQSPANNHSCEEYRNRLRASVHELSLIPGIEALYHDENITGCLFKD
jgi:predicted lipase